MSVNAPSIFDVLIAGAGPSSLLLACELQLAGCKVLVLEQSNDPNAPSKAMPFDRLGLTLPTIESLDRHGLLETLEQAVAHRELAGSPPPERQRRRLSGHFAGIEFFYDKIEHIALPRCASARTENVAADIATIESVLTARAASLGVEIQRARG